MRKAFACVAMVAGLALAGCGESRSDRAISGGALTDRSDIDLGKPVWR